MRSLLVLLLPVASFAYDWQCNLYCYNEGECRHGKGRFGSYGNVDEETPWESKSHMEGMYCACPIGSVGLQCEISLEVCGMGTVNDNHICYNGNECLKETSGFGKTYYHCECNTDTVFENPYVAKYCEHIATVFCGHNNNEDKGASSNFCTNGGKCKEPDADGTKHPGCICTEGWEGSHCTEKTEGSWIEQGEAALWEAATAKNIVGFVFLAVAVVFLGLGCLKYCDKRKKRRRRRQEIIEDAEFGTGLMRKRPSGRKSGRKSSAGRPSTAAASPREHDSLGLTPFRDEAEGSKPGPQEII